MSNPLESPEQTNHSPYEAILSFIGGLDKIEPNYNSLTNEELHRLSNKETREEALKYLNSFYPSKKQRELLTGIATIIMYSISEQKLEEEIGPDDSIRVIIPKPNHNDSYIINLCNDKLYFGSGNRKGNFNDSKTTIISKQSPLDSQNFGANNEQLTEALNTISKTECHGKIMHYEMCTYGVNEQLILTKEQEFAVKP